MKRVMTLTLPGEIMFTRVASQMAVSAATLLTGKHQAISEGKNFADAFELAVSEAFTNSVRYADQHRKPQTITVTCIFDRRQLSISVQDSNAPFSIDTPEPDIANYPEKGYGLMIIRKVMDTLTYRREDGFNVITMSKKF